MLQKILDPQNIMIAVACVIAVNAILSGIKVALDAIKDLTKSEADNKASAILGSILGFLGKIVDWLSANVQHK